MFSLTKILIEKKIIEKNYIFLSTKRFIKKILGSQKKVYIHKVKRHKINFYTKQANTNF